MIPAFDPSGATSEKRRLSLLAQGEEVATRIFEEGHPLLGALLAELAAFVLVDHGRRLQEGDPALFQLFDGLIDVIDPEIKSCLRRGGGQQQPKTAAEIEKSKTRRIKARYEAQPKDIAIEVHGCIEIGGLQRDLVDFVQSEAIGRSACSRCSAFWRDARRRWLGRGRRTL